MSKEDPAQPPPITVGERWRFGVGFAREMVRRRYYTRTIESVWYWQEAGCWMCCFVESLPLPYKSWQWAGHVLRGKKVRGA